MHGRKYYNILFSNSYKYFDLHQRLYRLHENTRVDLCIACKNNKHKHI